MSNSFDRWVGQVAIVTGASAGIGAAVAEKLVTAGVIVSNLLIIYGFYKIIHSY